MMPIMFAVTYVCGCVCKQSKMLPRCLLIKNANALQFEVEQTKTLKKNCVARSIQ